MKTVLRNHEEVAHIWVQQTQAEGRASRVFFDGPTRPAFPHGAFH